MSNHLYLDDPNHPYHKNKVSMNFWKSISEFGKGTIQVIVGILPVVISFVGMFVVLDFLIKDKPMPLTFVTTSLLTSTLSVILAYQLEKEKEKVGIGSNFIKGLDPSGYLMAVGMYLFPILIYPGISSSKMIRNLYKFKKRYTFMQNSKIIEINPGWMIKIALSLYSVVKVGSKQYDQLAIFYQEARTREPQVNINVTVKDNQLQQLVDKHLSKEPIKNLEDPVVQLRVKNNILSEISTNNVLQHKALNDYIDSELRKNRLQVV